MADDVLDRVVSTGKLLGEVGLRGPLAPATSSGRSGPRGRDGRDGLRGHAESARQGTGVQGGAVLQTSAGGHRQQNHGYNLRARSTENQIAQRHDPLSRDFATPLSGRFSVPAALPLSPRLMPRSPHAFVSALTLLSSP